MRITVLLLAWAAVGGHASKVQAGTARSQGVPTSEKSPRLGMSKIKKAVRRFWRMSDKRPHQDSLGDAWKMSDQRPYHDSLDDAEWQAKEQIRIRFGSEVVEGLEKLFVAQSQGQLAEEKAKAELVKLMGEEFVARLEVEVLQHEAREAAAKAELEKQLGKQFVTDLELEFWKERIREADAKAQLERRMGKKFVDELEAEMLRERAREATAKAELENRMGKKYVAELEAEMLKTRVRDAIAQVTGQSVVPHHGHGSREKTALADLLVHAADPPHSCTDRVFFDPLSAEIEPCKRKKGDD